MSSIASPFASKGALEGTRHHPRFSVHRLDSERACLRTVRHKRRKQIGHLYVATLLLLEALHVVPVAPPARFADNGENRDTDIGQDVRGHRGA